MVDSPCRSGRCEISRGEGEDRANGSDRDDIDHSFKEDRTEPFSRVDACGYIEDVWSLTCTISSELFIESSNKDEGNRGMYRPGADDDDDDDANGNGNAGADGIGSGKARDSKPATRPSSWATRSSASDLACCTRSNSKVAVYSCWRKISGEGEV